MSSFSIPQESCSLNGLTDYNSESVKLVDPTKGFLSKSANWLWERSKNFKLVNPDAVRPNLLIPQMACCPNELTDYLSDPDISNLSVPQKACCQN